jgi:urease accessory protein
MCSTLPMSTDRNLGRLLTWFSPAFPVGGYSYSHGLEFAVEAGMVTDSAALRQWIDAILCFGAGRADAILLGEAWRAEAARDEARLAGVIAWGEAFRGTNELALESAAQGAAFLAAVRAAWPHPRLDALLGLTVEHDRDPAYPVAVGVACAAFEIDEEAARLAFLQAFAANLVSAGVRLIPLGQSDGLRVLAALEATVREVATECDGLGVADLGTVTWMVDWCSARHETQYTRLFRS